MSLVVLVQSFYDERRRWFGRGTTKMYGAGRSKSEAKQERGKGKGGEKEWKGTLYEKTGK